MKYFVVSDIHSFYDEFIAALDKSGFEFNKDNRLIICGDLFDRGSQTNELLSFIKEHREEIILIKGNHEYLAEQLAERGIPFQNDISNGTVNTFNDLGDVYGGDSIMDTYINSGYKEVVDSMLNYFETKNYIFVHGWIPTFNKMDNEYLGYLQNWREVSTSKWEQASWTLYETAIRFEVYEENKKIVCGHQHCSKANLIFGKGFTEFDYGSNFDIFENENFIAIDACTALTKKVNVLIVEDEEKE